MPDEIGYLQQEAAKYGVPLGMPGAGPGGFAGGVQQEPIITVGMQHSGNPNMPSAIKTAPKQLPLSALLTQFDGFTAKQKRDLAARMVRAGLLPEPPQGVTIDEWVKKIPLSQVRAAYAGLLEDTAERNAAGQPTLTPGDLLNQQVSYYKDNFKDGKVAGSEEEEPPFTGVKKDKSVHVDIYSPSEARGLIRNVLKAELGREPTEDEFEDFRASLNAEAEDNPEIGVTRTRYVEGEAVRSRTRTSGGIDPTTHAVEWAQSQPGWAEWQAVGTYFPTVMNMLGSGVPGV